ncbi:MAG: hypothetical protein M0P31_14930 [Solirubrobacteraceae bacterium]|nr:hypothetical protein [Solirubrobacteraceae bacterium]
MRPRRIPVPVAAALAVAVPGPAHAATADGGSGASRLRAVGWGRVAFRRGRLTLSRLGGPMSHGGGVGCDAIDHATVSGRGRIRRLTLWTVTRPTVRCLRATDRVRLVPVGGWTTRTVGWPTPIEPVTPGLRSPRPVGFSGAVLQPDRRTIVVPYGRGACEGVTSAAATLDGRTATIDLRIGATVPPDRACIAILVMGTTMVRLPARAPAGVRIVDANAR